MGQDRFVVRLTDSEFQKECQRALRGTDKLTPGERGDILLKPRLNFAQVEKVAAFLRGKGFEVEPDLHELSEAFNPGGPRYKLKNGSARLLVSKPEMEPEQPERLGIDAALALAMQDLVSRGVENEKTNDGVTEKARSVKFGGSFNRKLTVFTSDVSPKGKTRR